MGTASLQKLMGWGVETVWSLSLQGHQDRTLSSSTVHRMINIDFQVNSSSESSQRQFPVTATSSPLHCLWTRSSSPALLLQPFHWPVSLTPNSSPPIQLLCYPVMSFLKFSYFFLLTRLWIKSNFRTSNWFLYILSQHLSLPFSLASFDTTTLEPLAVSESILCFPTSMSLPKVSPQPRMFSYPNQALTSEYHPTVLNTSVSPTGSRVMGMGTQLAMSFLYPKHLVQSLTHSKSTMDICLYLYWTVLN